MMNDKLKNIVIFLKSLDLFKTYDDSILFNIASAIKLIYIQSDEILMREGDPADSFYLVMHGRLRAFSNYQVPGEAILGEIGQGEIVGEVALLIDDVRMATVQAIRDSVLLKFDRKTFQSLLQKYPAVIMNIAKASIKRLAKKSLPKNTIVTIAVLPAGSNASINQFVNHLTHELKKLGPTLYLNSASFTELLGGEIDHTQAVSWLNEQENNYHYIIYEADTTLSRWTSRCLRQADRILFVGKSSDAPRLNEIETEFFGETYLPRHELAEFILIHEDGQKIGVMTQWLQIRPVRNYYNFNAYHASDFARLSRFLTGTAQGLVLSGGGARALSHLGVLWAIQELGIEIDMIGGTSMGAWLAAFYASNYNCQKMIEDVGRWVKRYNQGQYTLPLVSLFNDSTLVDMLKESVGSKTMIEDLWRRYFCISTNLSQNELAVHDRGLLWHAIRASLSIPGIFPPVFAENNDLLVDGSTMNNLPVDVMHNYVNGGDVIAVSIDHRGKQTRYRPQSLSSGWKLLLYRFHPGRKKVKYPSFGRIVFQAATLSSRLHEADMQKEANYWLELNMNKFGLLDFKAYRELVNAGYEAAKDKLTRKPFNSLKRVEK